MICYRARRLSQSELESLREDKRQTLAGLIEQEPMDEALETAKKT